MKRRPAFSHSFDQEIRTRQDPHQEEPQTRWQDLRDLAVKERASASDPVPKTTGQALYADAIRSHPLVFCNGLAGTGKSWIALGIGCRMIINGDFEKLIVVRPMIECGRKLGAVPGDLRDKLAPYLEAVKEIIDEFVGAAEASALIASGKISLTTFETMRGKTLKNAFVVCDEMQNSTPDQMLMLLTRIGDNTKMVVNGDDSGHQSDIAWGNESGLGHAMRVLEDQQIAKISLGVDDIVRSGLVKIILSQWNRKTI